MNAVRPFWRSVGDAVYIAREAAATRRARRATLREFRTRSIPSAPERHLAAAIDWLCRAQDACPDGGVSYGYDVRHGWSAAYPETTGYIIPTLFDYAARGNGFARATSDELRRRAASLAQWLIRIQLESGGLPGGTVLRVPQATVFNTGQVLNGWCRAWRETRADEIGAAARRAAAWMASSQDSDGCWRQGLSPLAQGTPATYNVRSAAALLEAGELFDVASWRKAATRNADWVLTQQTANGWFENNCVMDNTQPLTHTIGYTLEGLLEFAVRTGSDRYLEAVRRASDRLLPHVGDDGFISGRFDADWRPAARWNCLTGASQLSLVWLRLAHFTGDERYREAAERTLDFVKATQRLDAAAGEDANVVGAVKGSDPIWGRYEPFAYPNWATKFFADAVLASDAAWRARTRSATALRVGYIVEDYPTFIVSEINELRRLGAQVTVLGAFRPLPEVDPVKEAIRRESLYLPRGVGAVLLDNAAALARKPLGYLSAAGRLVARGESLRFLLLGACHAQVVVRDGINHLHGTFGTRTTTLAHVISRLTGVEYSFTTHAYDVFRPNPSLVWKTNEASFMRTISRFNRTYIERTYPGIDTSRIRVIHLGVDGNVIRPKPNGARVRPLRVVAIGSLIEQKGHLVLVRSCDRLRRRQVAFECRIIGEGPIRARLEQEIQSLGLGAAVRLEGDLPHARTMSHLEEADVFALPCIDMRGRGEHVDGIPVVLMEAMAMGLPVVSTNLSGIPELIDSGRSGLLVPPEDPDRLADAIEQLAGDAALRERLGAAARRTATERFDLSHNTSELVGCMRLFARAAAR